MTVDMPGQGDLPFQDLCVRPDFEIPMGRAVDCALGRPDVDPKRIAVYGISAGGYIAPRAASRERRIAACVANSMIFDLYRYFRCSKVQRIKGPVKWIIGWMAPFILRMLELLNWRWGVGRGDFPGLVENRDFVFDPAEIACPTPILVGEGEFRNPEIRRQQRRAMEALPDPRKKLVLGSADEGAAHHCMGENPGLMGSFVFDWPDEIFREAGVRTIRKNGADAQAAEAPQQSPRLPAR
jgi:pimeloyl-ACP methyl ester carboxylesterase